MKSLKAGSLLSFLLALCWCTTAYSQITPSGDAYTNTAFPTKNFGTSAVLDVESGSQITYIQFDLSSLPSGYTGANISKATLKLYVNAVTTAGSFNVDFIDGTWSEKTITADLSPALGTTIVSSVPLTASSVHDYMIIDITAALTAWLDGTQTNDGIALVGNSPLNASFDSKESTTMSHPAELDVVFAGGGTITGVTTAAGSGLTGGGTSGTLNLALTNTCGANQVLQWNGSSWACAAVGAGTITGVTAGSGLLGGGTSGNVMLNVDPTKVPQLSGGNGFSGNQSVAGNVTFTGLLSGGTANLAASNSSNILNVAQNGPGLGIYSSNAAPSVSAIYGTSSSASGIGIQGVSTAATGGTAMIASTNSTSGIALFAGAGASTGTSLGIQAQTNSASGTGLLAINSAGGPSAKFVGSVSVTGNTSVSGNVSSTGQLISTVATGTAPLTVNSATQVANLNASLLGGQPASAFATTGTNNFSGNQTVNGSLTATGTVNGGVLNATTSFDLGGVPFAFGSLGSANAFFGFAGNIGTTSGGNTATGYIALNADTTGSDNTATGYGALADNTTGIFNNASGVSALFNNTTGKYNNASGSGALFSNTTGCCNTASGLDALFSNTLGTGNTADGYLALNFAVGNNNTGLGTYAGNPTNAQSTTGSSNTFVGYLSNTGTQLALSNATAIGANAQVTASNSLVLGSINGVNSATADTAVGIGTTAPTNPLTVVGNSTYIPLAVQSPNTFGTWMTLANTSAGAATWNILSAASGNSEGAGNLAFTNFNPSSTVYIHANLHVDGNVSKGGGSFQIDHPLDPANKYLYHSFVESPDMMNVYNGNITTNKNGLAKVVLPAYFEALNRDFRYQLTVIGQFAQAIIAKEISRGRFTIRTSKPGVKVSWQVTGIRHDAYADAHRIPVEEEKPLSQRGKYLHPELFGASPELAIGAVPSRITSEEQAAATMPSAMKH